MRGLSLWLLRECSQYEEEEEEGPALLYFWRTGWDNNNNEVCCPRFTKLTSVSLLVICSKSSGKEIELTECWKETITLSRQCID